MHVWFIDRSQPDGETAATEVTAGAAAAAPDVAKAAVVDAAPAAEPAPVRVRVFV